MNVQEACAELQRLQRRRSVVIGSRIMLVNRIIAVVAGFEGYHTGLEESDRKQRFEAARELLEAVRNGDGDDHPLYAIILAHLSSIMALEEEQKSIDADMLTCVKKLPVLKWLNHADRRGVAPGYLAVIIGETGDLSNYANPAKVWRRLGLAPFTKDGTSQMGSTWRRCKGLTKQDWSDFGYSPRRRSIAYVLGENLQKTNGDGPYRSRYLQAKADAIANHPEWVECRECGGEGQIVGKGNRKKKCGGCKGTGQKTGRAHLHGMALASKMFLRDLWCAWNKRKVYTPEEAVKALR